MPVGNVYEDSISLIEFTSRHHRKVSLLARSHTRKETALGLYGCQWPLPGVGSDV